MRSNEGRVTDLNFELRGSGRVHVLQASRCKQQPVLQSNLPALRKQRSKPPLPRNYVSASFEAWKDAVYGRFPYGPMKDETFFPRCFLFFFFSFFFCVQGCFFGREEEEKENRWAKMLVIGAICEEDLAAIGKRENREKRLKRKRKTRGQNSLKYCH